jgi:hypothetical protein
VAVSKYALSQVQKRLESLEADDAGTNAPVHVSDPVAKLRARMEIRMDPRIVETFSNEERREMFAHWQLLQILSTTTLYYDAHTRLKPVAALVNDAARTHLDEILARPKDYWDSSEVPTGPDDWRSINPVTLNELKVLIRADICRFDQFGVARAESVRHLLTMDPWERGFDATPATWPVEVVERLKASESWPPDEVPPFDWVDVHVYQWMHPFPRDQTGRPLPEAMIWPDMAKPESEE